MTLFDYDITSTLAGHYINRQSLVGDLTVSMCKGSSRIILVVCLTRYGTGWASASLHTNLAFYMMRI